MFKNYLIIFLFIFLSNCSHPGTALLGPAFTGVTTKSLGQASVSFGKNLVIKQVREASKSTKNQAKKIAKKVEDLNSQMKSNDFYASVKNLYFQDHKQKKKIFLFHR
mgnify:FL=1|tara:strand:+ start:824 stop:1144 length:321 start_codon:yes stop_codon:yes gene_type:complete